MDELIFVNTCSHNFCTYCIADHQYFQKKKSENPLCPIQGCNVPALWKEIHIFQERQNNKQKQELEKITKNKPKTKDEVDNSCIICENAKREAAFYKCGHKCCCLSCANKFIGKPCPLCTIPVVDILKVYDA